MKKILFLALPAALLFSCSKSGGDDGPNPPEPNPGKQQDIAAVDSKLTGFLTTHNVPGATLAISKNGKLVYVQGYGFADQATNTKVTTQSRFRIASVSKTYTAVAVLKLAQEGKFSLDDKVFGEGKLLGTTYGTAPYNTNLGNITVRQLLNNTSGAWGAATGGDVIDQNPAYTNTQLFNWILNTRPNPQTPGALYDYSNINFWIAGRIIEKFSGKSYVNYIREDLMAPLGITQTDMAGKTAADRKTNEVTYYGQGNDAPYVYNIAFPRRDADGGLITTATDLLKFILAIDGFTTRPDMINATSVTALSTGSPVYASYGLGLGLWSAQNLWYNYGSLPGTRAGFMRHNNGMAIALIFNSRANPSAETAFVQGMQNLMLDLIKNTDYSWQDIDQF
ncbi:beta-lactamase family protein [Terrimonas sp. NA20]|uniref:Beta-lactamase family protein n=1 Tax=Terrimonas ginsenosidimutans TaxID=2908004 RepID=A0ABS9KW38_9BACT|nr:serine hydrolase domain-containing protein [Terrimonas ginsenosidimutans]MCG2616551.1 beta-lactamase family protein [Terrimonas ginsenosidimutans]